MGISNNTEYDRLIIGSFTAISQTLDVTTSNSVLTTIQITGTWSGTILMEISNDNSNWTSIPVLNISNRAFVNSITSNGVYTANTTGYANLRLRSSTWSSGTAALNIFGSDYSDIYSQHYSNVVDNNNSSISTLTANSTFTGEFTELINYNAITVLVRADQASADEGVKIEWSADGSTVHADDLFFHQGVHGDQWSFGVAARYYRVRYVNGTTNQGTFTLQTLLHPSGFKSSSHRIDDPIDADDDAELVKSTITGKASNGNYYNVAVDTDGRLITSATTGYNSNFSFGDVSTSATTLVPVRRTTYTEQSSNAQRSIASSSASDDNSPPGTGARTVRLTYLDSTGAGPYTEDIQLNGTSYVNTTNTNICFIEKIQVLTTGSSSSNVGTLTLKATTGGGGATIGTINAGDNQTLWCHHYIPTGKVSYITGISFGNDAIDIGNGALFYIKKKTVGQSTEIQVSDFLRLYGADSGTHSRNYDSPITISGPALVTMYVAPRTSNTQVQIASFDFFEP